MKLKLFENQEIPEWLPANVIRFSRFSEQTIKLFSEAVIDSILSGSLKFSKIQSQIGSPEQVEEVKAILGSLKVILVNATKQQLTEVMLSSDLQLLGLPYHYQLSICRPYSEHKMELQEALSSQLLQLSKNVSFDWNIHTIINSEDDHFLCNEITITLSSPTGIVEMKEGTQRLTHVCQCMLSEPMYHRMSHELRKASSLMSIYMHPYLSVYLNKHTNPHLHSQYPH